MAITHSWNEQSGTFRSYSHCHGEQKDTSLHQMKTQGFRIMYHSTGSLCVSPPHPKQTESLSQAIVTYQAKEKG